MKIRPVGAELFHSDRHGGRIDMKKQIVAFRNFAKAPTTPKKRTVGFPWQGVEHSYS